MTCNTFPPAYLAMVTFSEGPFLFPYNALVVAGFQIIQYIIHIDLDNLWRTSLLKIKI